MGYESGVPAAEIKNEWDKKDYFRAKQFADFAGQDLSIEKEDGTDVNLKISESWTGMNGDVQFNLSNDDISILCKLSRKGNIHFGARNLTRAGKAAAEYFRKMDDTEKKQEFDKLVSALEGREKTEEVVEDDMEKQGFKDIENVKTLEDELNSPFFITTKTESGVVDSPSMKGRDKSTFSVKSFINNTISSLEAPEHLPTELDVSNSKREGYYGKKHDEMPKEAPAIPDSNRPYDTGNTVIASELCMVTVYSVGDLRRDDRFRDLEIDALFLAFPNLDSGIKSRDDRKVNIFSDAIILPNNKKNQYRTRVIWDGMYRMIKNGGSNEDVKRYLDEEVKNLDREFGDSADLRKYYATHEKYKEILRKEQAELKKKLHIV